MPEKLKMKLWKGQDLKGRYTATMKLDGVCCIIDQEEQTVVSRSGKPLYNFQNILKHRKVPSGMYECFLKDWEASVSLVRTRHTANIVLPKDLYRIDRGSLDRRLFVMRMKNPTGPEIQALLDAMVANGKEGLVLWSEDTQAIWKVKPKVTVDIKITGLVEGTGKHKGMLGAFKTNYGNIGTGFSDSLRDDIWNGGMYIESCIGDIPMDHKDFIGGIIEVEFMQWTKDKKMRHPVFKRFRWDKTEENLER